MPEVFYWLIAILFAGYVVLDGFDLGAGTLHLHLAKTDSERRTVLAAIGPYWDGNEVWLLAAAGTMLLAFPRALGAALSGLYLAVFFTVWSLMLRGLAIELRNHLENELWRSFWDFVFMASSALLPVLLGVAAGNVIRGFSLDEAGRFSVPLFTSWMPRAPAGLLDVYTLGVGAFVSVALVSHGATFLAWKTSDELQRRALGVARVMGLVTCAAWPLVAFASARVARLGASPATWILAGIVVIALASRWWFVRCERLREAFLASCAFLACTVVGVASARAPVLISSLDGAHELTVATAAASPRSFSSALAWWPVAFVLALVYLLALFRIHKGKARTD